MNQGKYVFSQVMDFIPRYQFNTCVANFQGHTRVKQFTCFEQFLAMSFGQLAYHESLRDIVVCLGAQKEKLYHLGFRSPVARSTLADANEKRDWRIYRDFTQILISEARTLYCNDTQFTLDLEGTFYVIDATTIELCASIFSWAHFRQTKAAIKLHTVMELKGNIPAFFSITSGKTHDVTFLNDIDWEIGAYYIMDRGYLDYEKWYTVSLPVPARQTGCTPIGTANKRRAFNKAERQMCVSPIINKKIRYYNNQRIHTRIGYQTPAAFTKKCLKTLSSAVYYLQDLTKSPFLCFPNSP